MATSKSAAPRRASIYVRISQDDTGKAAGVQRQEAECRDLCERLGLDVAEVFTDNDISATSGKVRPEFERLLASVPEGGSRLDCLMRK